MTFYVLNHTDHSFQDFQFPEEAIREIQKLLAENVNRDSIIVLSTDPDSTMTADQFQTVWG